MNSRQRRGIILLLLSVLCAFGAFAGVLSVISDVNSKVGPEVDAYRVKSDVAPYQALQPGQFEKIKIPKRWLSKNAVTDVSVVGGKVAVTQLKKGSLLQDDMFVKRPELDRDEQEIAIMIDAATGVAGKIRAGDAVNIYATFPADDQGGVKAQSRVIVPNARVLDVGRLTALEPKEDDRRGTLREAVPITFALTTKDAQRVAYAESFAVNVRLALLAAGGSTQLRPGEGTYTLEGDK
ncbi:MULTISPECIES: Flp pilus assembly protein CpaB [Streptomyces]|uniref:Flp pilus assembly protein CpaB n=1 Tax=Streptomyces pratisoli TaxID=3139917 RepID=A0ACC6QLP9_9ACTN|nr:MULTISPECIES: Flp pilus assembly protein CpaB [unclassified Streptomyces]MCX4512953.1 Flp pilus assembly protein CpaB [Streptomyces sp. NBC_01619]